MRDKTDHNNCIAPDEAVHQSGFTLIGVAIILVLVGILVASGARFMSSIVKRSKILETKKTIDAAVESMVIYGTSNNELPASGSFASTLTTSEDVWGKSLFYIVDADLTDSTTGGICDKSSTDLTLTICPDSGCSSPTDTISNVAFIVLSSGGNFNNQTAGTQDISSSATVNVYTTEVNIDAYTADMNRSEAYDDLAGWLSVSDLNIKAGCVSSELRVVNNELPYGYVSSSYSGTVYGDGGVLFSSGGTYRWCRQEDSSSGLTFTPSVLSANCLGLTESSWTQADSITISGTPAAAGTYTYTFFVRDDNDSSSTDDNITRKRLVLTINASGSCTDYRVWNNTGAKYDFQLDAVCKKANNGNEITKASQSKLLNSGESIQRYDTSNNSCGGSVAATFTYSQAEGADSDGDCQVYYDATDR